MFQEAYNRLNPDSRTEKPDYKQGCLTFLILFFIIYFSYAAFLIFPNAINHIKWRLRGSANYTYTISDIGLLPPDIQIGRKVVIKEGKIASVSNLSLAEPVYSEDIGTFEEMYNSVYSCSILFPLIVCSWHYDPFYGYPSEVTVNCPIPDACYTYTAIRDVNMLSP